MSGFIPGMMRLSFRARQFAWVGISRTPDDSGRTLHTGGDSEAPGSSWTSYNMIRHNDVGSLV